MQHPAKAARDSVSQGNGYAALTLALTLPAFAVASMGKRYFEDITEGEPLDCRKVVITREDIIEYGYRYLLACRGRS